MQYTEYERKKASELAWYHQRPDDRSSLLSRILHHPVVYTRERAASNYVFPKRQMAEAVRRCLKGEKVDRLLIAPCGTGNDFPYLREFAEEVHGIDLSPTAVENCPTAIKAVVGDISAAQYPNETFDLIASPLFFHHLLEVGFAPFLEEFSRILKQGGKLVVLEPSILHPLNLITRPIKRIARNPYGEVEDEGPFYPGLMIRSLKQAGFVNIELRGASFSHCSLYTPLARFVNVLTKPLLNVWPLGYFAWMAVFCAERPRSEPQEPSI